MWLLQYIVTTNGLEDYLNKLFIRALKIDDKGMVAISFKEIQNIANLFEMVYNFIKNVVPDKQKTFYQISCLIIAKI